MPLFLCFQSSYLSCIYYLEVMFSLGCTVLCLLWGGVLNWCWSVPISRKKRKRCSHHECRARAKARVPKF